MKAGIDWSWDSFTDYLDAVQRAPKAINYATQIGHSALRTWAMGERAFGDQATDDDMRMKTAALDEALRAGAVGFATSISDHHVTPDGRPIASRSTSWEELTALVRTVGRAEGRVFQLAIDTERAESNDVERALSFYDELADLAVETRVPITFWLRSQHLQEQLDLFDRVAGRGGTMFGQCQSTTATALFSFRTVLPFGGVPEWREVLTVPEVKRDQFLRDHDVRRGLFAAVPPSSLSGIEQLTVLRGAAPFPRIGDLAREKRLHPVEVMIEVALEADLWQLFGRVMTPAEEEAVLRAMRHPRTVMTLSDAGAHVSMLSGADLHTTLLAQWVRERQEISLEEAVRMITQAPATAWGFRGRGLLREGLIADVNVFDPETVGPDVPRLADDLPAGARRVVHPSKGFPIDDRRRPGDPVSWRAHRCAARNAGPSGLTSLSPSHEPVT